MSNIEELKVLFEKQAQEIKEIKGRFAEMAKPAVESMGRGILDKYSFVESMHFLGFYPYFNDGSACEYSIQAVCFTLEGHDQEDYESTTTYTQENLVDAKNRLKEAQAYQDDKEGWIQKFKDEYENKNRRPWNAPWEPCPYPKDPAHAQQNIDTIEQFLDETKDISMEEFLADFKNFEAAIRSIDLDVMEDLFGDHSKVIISRDGVEIEEYTSHD